MPERSTADLVVLMVTGTMCVVLALAATAVLVVALASPETDVSGEVANLGHALAILVGAMAGYLAGRTRTRRDPPE